MRVLEIQLNGKKLCTAGHAGPGVVTAFFSFFTRLHERDGLPKEQITLRVRGLDSQSHEHVSWSNRNDLAVGDEIILRVVDASSCDAPGSRRPQDDEKRRKDYVLSMAKQFGWKVEIPP